MVLPHSSKLAHCLFVCIITCLQDSFDAKTVSSYVPVPTTGFLGNGEIGKVQSWIEYISLILVCACAFKAVLRANRVQPGICFAFACCKCSFVAVSFLLYYKSICKLSNSSAPLTEASNRLQLSESSQIPASPLTRTGGQHHTSARIHLCGGRAARE